MVALQMRALMDILDSVVRTRIPRPSDPKDGTVVPIAAGWEGSFRTSRRYGASDGDPTLRRRPGVRGPVQRRRRGPPAPTVAAGRPAPSPHPRRDRRAGAPG